MDYSSKNKLSVVVVFYNMRREAERTLYTLSAEYQRGVQPSQWEVIAVDNGSSEPLGEAFVKSFGKNFSYRYFDTQSLSPCMAVNEVVEQCSGENVSICLDGARMCSPQIIRYSLLGLTLAKRSFVCTLGWHLGPDVQNRLFEQGYGQKDEDTLLDSVDWQQNGYQLFDVSTLAPSSGGGFFRNISESSFFTVRREKYLCNGGLDERFVSPGGGLASCDLYRRFCESGRFTTVHIIGEGSFHQFHGGVTTNVQEAEHPRDAMRAEYRQLRGRPFAPPIVEPMYIGHLPAPAARFLAKR